MRQQIKIEELDKLTLKIFSEIENEIHASEFSLIVILYISKLHEKLKEMEEIK